MVNTLHLQFLDQIARLDSFSGKCDVGVRLGGDGHHTSSDSLDSMASDKILDEYKTAGVGEEDDLIHNFMNFELSIHE